MKNSLLLSFFILSSLCAFTQLSFTIGPQISAGAKTKENGVGISLSAEGTISICKNGKLRLHSAYTRFPANNYSSVSYIPIRAGYQHQFFNRFIVLGDIGTGTLFYPEYNFTRLSYGLGAGYTILLNKNFLQFSVVYEHTKDIEGYFGWVNYRLAYGINFKK